MASVKNVFIQLLPVIKPKSGIGKVLLVKWNLGPFANRYTGMIKNIGVQESVNLSKFKESAASLLPKGLHKDSTENIKISLVAILEFPDPPGCDEYVYIAELPENGGELNPKPYFDETNPCFWFDFDKIPFKEMPEDDEIWYHKVLSEEKKLRGSFTFGSWEEKKLKSYWIKEVDNF